MTLDYPLELGSVNSIVGVERVALVADNEVKVRLDGRFRGRRGRSDTEDVEGPRRDL